MGEKEKMGEKRKYGWKKGKKMFEKIVKNE